MKKDDLVYIERILASINKISGYIHKHDIDSFLKSDQTQDAVIRQLEIIGEATKKITNDLKAKTLKFPGRIWLE